MALSERQSKILSFLRTFILDNGYPPTIREIGKAVEISSTSVVNYNLEALQRAGHIYRDRTVSRGIRLSEGLEELTGSENLIRIPLVGNIAAGEPLMPFEDAYDSDYDYLEVTADLVPQEEKVFALKVEGYSMIDALINDGDIVIMRPAETAETGEMVAAWLQNEGETTLKRFYHEGHRIRLQPENQAMDPIYADPDNVEIKGKVIAVIRQLH